MTIELHCSSLPRILSCHASAVPPASGIIIEGDEEASATGTDVHRCMAALLSGQENPPLPSGPRALFLYWQLRRMWGEIATAFDGPQFYVEQPLRHEWDDIALCGTPDVRALIGDTLYVVDWKTGVEKDVTAQLLGYLDLALSLEVRVEKFVSVVAWAQSGVLDVRHHTLDDIEGLQDKIDRAVADPTHFRPNTDNCIFCPRRHECPALREQTTSLVKTFGGECTTLPAVQMAELLPRVKALAARCNEFEETFKVHVASAPDGKLQVPCGHWEHKPVSKREIDAARALPVLVERLGDLNSIAPAIDISTSGIIKIARDRATGTKKAAEDELMSALADAGAVVTKTEKRLTFVKEE